MVRVALGLLGRGVAGRGKMWRGMATYGIGPDCGPARRVVLEAFALAISENLDVDQISNDGSVTIDLSRPYTVGVEIRGDAALLLHRWSCDDVEAKGRAAKGSAAKKTDNIDSYVYRDAEGNIALPGAYLKGSVAGPQGAAKFRQDPRSPRKSALDLYKAGLQVISEFAAIYGAGSTSPAATWDYLDKQRVTVQRNGVTRVRPAFSAGWRAAFDLLVLTPEYITPADLQDVLVNAGRLVGLGDFRPTYGRFAVTRFQIR